jgi:SAM-dependent methyltransferase
MRPYNRSLHPDDYEFLTHAEALKLFEGLMTHNNVPKREWHPHRFWEYASMMQQLEELGVPHEARIIDVGSGASFFPPYLVTIGGYPNVELTDSMKYGDVTAMIEGQRAYFDIKLPLHDLLCEDMSPLPSNSYDVTMCISTVEHVDDHDAAFWEMVRITKSGGYIFITSDYFRDLEHFEQSISRHLQVTPYRKEFVMALPDRFPVDFVGATDFDYKGDFVHNYSFCNVCLRKR